MPEEIDYAPLIQRLIGKTREGHIDWTPGSGEDIFVAKVDKYIFVIQKAGTPSIFTHYLRMYEGPGQVMAVIARKHAAGRIDTYFAALAELYELARQRALKIDD